MLMLVCDYGTVRLGVRVVIRIRVRANISVIVRVGVRD